MFTPAAKRRIILNVSCLLPCFVRRFHRRTKNGNVFVNIFTATNDGIDQKRTLDFGETIHGGVFEIHHT
jgi:hypothetical protein